MKRTSFAAYSTFTLRRVRGRRDNWLGRMWNKIDQSAGAAACHPWRGMLTKQGRPMMKSAYCSTTIRPQRIVFDLRFPGQLAPRKHVRAKCGNYTCCNPEHLEIGGAKRVNDNRVKGKNAAADIRLLRSLGITYKAIGTTLGISTATAERVMNKSRST